MKLPGIAALHCVITDQCRENRTDYGALEEVIHRLRREYSSILENRKNEKGVNYRVVLLVEDTKRG